MYVISNKDNQINAKNSLVKKKENSKVTQSKGARY